MCSKEQREQLRQTAETALAFIFDECDDSELYKWTMLLLQDMRKLCDEKK